MPDEVNLDDCALMQKEHDIDALLAREDRLLFWRALNVMNTCVLHLREQFGPRIYDLDAEDAGDRFPDLLHELDQTSDRLSLSVALQCSRCLDLPRVDRIPTFAADVKPNELMSTTDTNQEATWLALLNEAPPILNPENVVRTMIGECVGRRATESADRYIDSRHNTEAEADIWARSLVPLLTSTNETVASIHEFQRPAIETLHKSITALS
jgi:hypothetical protein